MFDEDLRKACVKIFSLSYFFRRTKDSLKRLRKILSIKIKQKKFLIQHKFRWMKFHIRYCYFFMLEKLNLKNKKFLEINRIFFLKKFY